MSLPRYDLLLIVLIGLWPSTFVIQSQMAKVNESVCTPAAQQHVNSSHSFSIANCSTTVKDMQWHLVPGRIKIPDGSQHSVLPAG